MIVPFVDFKLQYRKLKPEIDEAITRVVSNGDFILRQDVEEFEKRLADYVGTKYAVGVNSGTDALTLALRAAGIKAGDEVITSAYTFWATVEAIWNVRATPILADIKEDLLIDPILIEEKITLNTKAIIPVHIGGNICDMDKIMRLAVKYNLAVIEDTAQGLGGEWGGIKAGAIGDIGCFSFYPAKVLGAYGDAGAIATNSFRFSQAVRALRDHGRLDKYGIFMAGYNSRLDNLQAAVLNAKFDYLPEWIKRRQEIGKMYDEGLKDMDGIVLPQSFTYQEFNLRVLGGKRDGLYHYLKDREIECLVGSYKFPCVQPPVAMMMNEQILRLPVWPDLSNAQIKFAIKIIREFYKK